VFWGKQKGPIGGIVVLYHNGGWKENTGSETAVSIRNLKEGGARNSSPVALTASETPGGGIAETETGGDTDLWTGERIRAKQYFFF